jgi:outer membrane protein OmpA-like peptidoglycan-associated protein
LVFAPETAALSAEAKATLKDLAARFPAHDENVRLQLIAYASGEGMSASKARRLSLARALSVREYLIANGIEGTRMDVRALGDEAGRLPNGSPAGSPANRVDIAMIKR